jgi:hypothetical protein
MNKVIVESPFRGDKISNKEYLIGCMTDCFNRGEAPFASHYLYTEVLDDDQAVQRELGMAAGFAWMQVADYVAVYCDLGISSGMKEGIKHARQFGLEVKYRSLESGDIPDPPTNT